MVNTLKELGLPYSDSELEKIQEDIIKRLEDFRTRELPADVFVVYIDAYCAQMKEKSGKIKKATIYTVLGVDLEGNRGVYGFYVLFDNENKGEWIKIFNDLISRGLKRLLLIVSDDLSGLDDAISAIFEHADHQLCFIHLQRNVSRNMSRADAAEFNQNLRQIRLYSGDYDHAKGQLQDLPR